MQERFEGLRLERQGSAESDLKLGELIIYISSTFECGAVQLNKTLWYSDIFSFADHGEAITGAQYMKEARGPVPVRLVPVREKLQEDRDIAILYERVFKFNRHRIVALREPNLDLFRARDIATVDSVINALRDRTAAEVSALSHKRAWEIAGDGEIIPYEAVFLSDAGVSTGDIAEARKLIEIHGWEDVL